MARQSSAAVRAPPAPAPRHVARRFVAASARGQRGTLAGRRARRASGGGVGGLGRLRVRGQAQRSPGRVGIDHQHGGQHDCGAQLAAVVRRAPQFAAPEQGAFARAKVYDGVPEGWTARALRVGLDREVGVRGGHDGAAAQPLLDGPCDRRRAAAPFRARQLDPAQGQRTVGVGRRRPGPRAGHREASRSSQRGKSRHTAHGWWRTSLHHAARSRKRCASSQRPTQREGAPLPSPPAPCGGAGREAILTTDDQLKAADYGLLRT
jgi:hypothetical protein